MADIMIEPNLAIYEKINYNRINADTALDELTTFYDIDNAANDTLMKYVLIVKESLNIMLSHSLNISDIRKKLLQYDRLTEWESLYLINLQLVEVNYQNSSKDAKFKSFFTWMIKEFRLSLVSIIYGIVLFSSLRMKQMIKFKINDRRDNQICQLRNMTWDLYFMNKFFRLWQGKANNEEIIFASDDNIIREIMRLAILIQKNGTLNVLEDYLHPSERKYLSIIDTIISSNSNSIYKSDMWTPEYRDELIKKKETSLLTGN